MLIVPCFPQLREGPGCRLDNTRGRSPSRCCCKSPPGLQHPPRTGGSGCRWLWRRPGLCRWVTDPSRRWRCLPQVFRGRLQEKWKGIVARCEKVLDFVMHINLSVIAPWNTIKRGTQYYQHHSILSLKSLLLSLLFYCWYHHEDRLSSGNR